MDSVSGRRMNPGIFRWPGGKLKLAKKIIPYFSNVFPIDKDKAFNCYDVFVGGGGMALNIAVQFPKCKLFLNDLNEGMYSFWSVIIDPDITNFNLLKDKVRDTTPTVELFFKFKDSTPDNTLDKAFKALFLNKTSFSGLNTYPIGGRSQKGKWGVGCVWNQKNLVKKLDMVRELLIGRTVVENLHFRDFLQKYNTNDGLIYLDPPYYIVGDKLYAVSMSKEEHIELSNLLRGRNNWILSYNKHTFIDEIYDFASRNEIEMIQSMTVNKSTRKRMGEYVIFPLKNSVTLGVTQ